MDADSLESLFLGAPNETVPETVRAASPLCHVHKREPPFLLMHGSIDSAGPVHQSVLFYQALVSQGTDVTLGVVRGLGHGCANQYYLDGRRYEIELRSGARSGAVSVLVARIFEFVGDWCDERLGAQMDGRSACT